jgi:hypothetical protein
MNEIDKEIQERIIAALPGDYDLALSSMCIVLAYMADVVGNEKIDRTVWSDSNKNAPGYRIRVDAQKVMSVPNEG